MGFRLHRSVQVIPGLRLNFSKSGLGVSTGVKGYHVSHMANGRTRRTISIPGTGMSWITEKSHAGAGHPRSTSPTPRATSPSEPAPTPAKPGWLSPKPEKDLYQALHTQDLAAIERLADTEPEVSLAAATIAGLALLTSDQDDAATIYLQRVFDTGQNPGTDPFITKYVTSQISLELVEGVTVDLTIDRSTIGLLLGELLQRKPAPDRAIEVVEQLEPTTLTALSLAEMYADERRYDDIIEITESCTNVDDATSLLCTFRGIAFREQAHYTAARVCFAAALRSRKRNPIVRHRAWFERARCYEAEGKRAMARKDLESILAEDSTYHGLTEALAELVPSPRRTDGAAEPAT